MVSNTNITALSKSGLKDFFLQRVSAIILMGYAIFLLIYLIACGSEVSYNEWLALFSCSWIKAITILAFLALIIHSWVGVWTILTDYVHNALVRGILQTVFIVGYVFSFIWMLQILWFL